MYLTPFSDPFFVATKMYLTPFFFDYRAGKPRHDPLGPVSVVSPLFFPFKLFADYRNHGEMYLTPFPFISPLNRLRKIYLTPFSTFSPKSKNPAFF
jgi:hypothetical protein